VGGTGGVGWRVVGGGWGLGEVSERYSRCEGGEDGVEE